MLTTKLGKILLLGMATITLAACGVSELEKTNETISSGLSSNRGTLGGLMSEESSTSMVEELVVEESIIEETVEEVGVEETDTVDQSVVGQVIGGTSYHEGLVDPLPQATTDNPVPSGYILATRDGGDQSGYREANVVVNIGFNDGPVYREYYAYTNEHGQLIKVIAKEIIVQDDNSEPIKSSGRYYHDEAKVPGVESDTLDEGHVIADSLGGVANAYNITPQNSTLNRHGDQAEFENDIRNSGGAYDFIYLMTYSDTQTQIPNHYYVEYTNKVSGIRFKTNFNNGDPEEYNLNNGYTGQGQTETPAPQPVQQAPQAQTGDVSSIDTNGNGTVTIKEAKEAGFSMPIYSDHWLYPYMIDRDGDGMVGE